MKSVQTYLVGGAVRDRLLGLPVYDRDWVVVGAEAPYLLDKGYSQVGADFPCFLHPKTKEEYSLARTERKQGAGYTGFVCDFGPDISLEEDLYRRDLTINAMAIDENNQVIDPYGGQQDLADKTLRHVSKAFVEDPLRVLRVARFAARFAHLGFSVCETTKSLMTEIAHSGELSTLTAERVWKECERALTETSPSVFFELLHEVDALKVLMPEVDALWGVPQTEKHHPEIDTGIHTMMCLEYAAKHYQDVAISWATVMHDLGKGITPQEEWPRHIAHEFKGKPLVKKLCKRLRVPKEMTDLSMLVCEYHLHCHRAFELKPATLVKLIRSVDGIRRPERFEKFLKACIADARGRLGFEDKDYPQADFLRECLHSVKAISVKEFVAQGMKGPEIAEALSQKQQQTIAELKRNWAS